MEDEIKTAWKQGWITAAGEFSVGIDPRMLSDMAEESWKEQQPQKTRHRDDN